MTKNDKLMVIDNYMHNNGLAKLATFMSSQSALAYIRNVMILVETDDRLWDCTPQSIMKAAARSASLELSLDPAAKQAYLVPYKDNRAGVTNAVFQPHYLGLRRLAMRTQRYKVIECIPLPKGYDVVYDLSGEGDGVTILKDEKPIGLYLPKTKPQDAGLWFAWAIGVHGESKKVWWTVEEIHAHAKQYAPAYNNKNSLWQSKSHKYTMEMKTVLRDLLGWLDLSGTPAGDVLSHEMNWEDPQAIIDAEAQDVVTIAQPKPAAKAAEPKKPAAKAETTKAPATKPRNAPQIIKELTGSGPDDYTPSPKLVSIKEKAKRDKVTAFWEIVRAAGVNDEEAQAIVKATAAKYDKAYEQVLAKYGRMV